MEDEIANLNQKLTRANEKIIKLDNDHLNLQDRIEEKNRELERLKGELAGMERMINNIDIGSNRKNTGSPNLRGNGKIRSERVMTRKTLDGNNYGEYQNNDDFEPNNQHSNKRLNFRSPSNRRNKPPINEFNDNSNSHKKRSFGIKERNEEMSNNDDKNLNNGNKISNEMQRPKKYFNNFVVGENDQQQQQNKRDAKAIAKAFMQGTGNFMTWNNPYDQKCNIF